jgi:dihydroorotate dehydrogenase (fumarate)
MDLTTQYLGLKLKNPLIASASPLNADVGNLRRLQDLGAAAVVLPSVFEEQITRESAAVEHLRNLGAGGNPEAMSYFPPAADFESDLEPHLEFVARASGALEIPVIASLNAVSAGTWTYYAAEVEKAGASAIELNIYFIASDPDRSGREVEQGYLDILRSVRATVSIPVAVKLSPYFSAMGHMAQALVQAGADGLVLFNRFYQPDIDLARLLLTNDLALSHPAEIRLPLLWIGMLSGRIKASLAASTGVDSADEVIKYLLAGADVVMTTSALLRHGLQHLSALLDGLVQWMEARKLESLDHVRGLMNQSRTADPAAFERAHYIKIIHGF